MANTLGQKNPLRYRGYVYDTETGFYYLQSRYYDPALGRFLNADAFASTGQGILGNNMFAYCNNNPVMGYDPTGELDWGKLANGAGLLSIGLTACAVAATVVTGGACAPLIVAATLTFGAGGMTVANGAAEMIESATGYNFMRDGLQGGNTQFYERQKAFFAPAAEAGTAALSMVGTSPYLCFVAGTVIVAAEGLRAIETIEAEDLVWAWDEETGDTALKEVVETYVNTTNELVHVFVDGEEIVTTPSHPFYSPVKGWTTAVHLRAGDILQLVNGEFAVVEKVQHEILETPVTVYNFQVEDYHTYYVSNAGVLVHNRCANKNTTTPWDINHNSQGQVKTMYNGKKLYAQSDGSYYWLKDYAGHSSSFKVFKQFKDKLYWYADADMYGNFISGKHKGPTGLKLDIGWK